MENSVIYPSMFRSNPLGFILAIILCPALIGVVILFVWWLKCKSTRLVVGADSISLDEGIFSKSSNEIYYRDIRNVLVKQSIFQRIFGVGYIGISSAGQSGIEIEINGIANPDVLRKFINSKRGLFEAR